MTSFLLQRRPFDPSQDRGRGTGGGHRGIRTGVVIRANPDQGSQQAARIIKAGKPVAITSSGASVVR